MPLDQAFFQFLSQISPFATLAGLSIAAAAFTGHFSPLHEKFVIFRKVSKDFLMAFFFFVGAIAFTTINSLFPNNDFIGAALIISFFVGIIFLVIAAYRLVKEY